MAYKILQCGYMSGDTYAAAALLAADKNCRILLVKDSKATGPEADKSAMIEKIYRESGVWGQVKVFDISSQPFGIKAFWDRIKRGARAKAGEPDRTLPARSTDRRSPTAPLTEWLCKVCLDEKPLGWPHTIGYVTTQLARCWENDPAGTQRAVAGAWRVGKLPTDVKFKLYEFMAGAFAKLNFDIRDNVVVLWSRQSGKAGGAHLELDSSFTGIRQLARALAKDKRATIVLSGDESARLKLAALASEDLHIVDVSAMWERDLWQDPEIRKVKFLTQFAFYKYLADDYRVIHLGMRSGMLESMALLGMEVFYLENLGSTSGDRMIKFENAGITYRRIQFTDSPGLTGRIAQQRHKVAGPEIQRRIADLAQKNKGRGDFRYNFAGPRIAREHTAWAARNFAKAMLVGEPLDDRSFDAAGDPWDALQHEMNRRRGFLTTDVDAIVKLVQGKYR